MLRCTGRCHELPGCSSCPHRVGPESASTTTAFFAPLGIVVWAHSMLVPFFASFPANSASAPGLLTSSICSSVPSVYGRPAAPRAFLAVHVVHHHLRRALRSCRAVQQGDDVHLRVGENLGHVSQGSGPILQRHRELLHFSHGMPPLLRER